MKSQIKAISQIIIFLFLALPSTLSAQTPDHESGVDSSKILVMTRFREGVDLQVTDAAVTTICDELEVTGFTVVRMDPVEDTLLNLRQFLGDAFDTYRTSIAVVISQTSLTDGTVMLFGRKGLDEVSNLDSEYVAFPLDRDKAELLAFKISEKAALLFDDARTSESPVPLASPPVNVPETQPEVLSPPASNSANSAPQSDDAPRNRWGIYLLAGGTAAPRDFFLGGGSLGVRWLPLIHKAFDLELSAYPLSNHVSNENASLSLGIAGCRGRVAHVIHLNHAVSLNIGVFTGAVFYWTVRKRVDDPRANELPRYSSHAAGALFHVGGTGEIVYRLTRHIHLPFRLEAGVVTRRADFVLEKVGGGGVVVPQTEASLGYLILAASVGVLVSF